MRYILFLVVVIIASFAGFMMNYLGTFKPVNITEQTKGPYFILYKNYVGPYHKTVSVITEVEKWAMDNGVGCKLSFGEYPDNPEKVEEARLKSRGGCIYDQQLAADIKAKLPAEFKTEEIPTRNYVQAIFDGSPGIGPMKVYPRVSEYMKEKNLKQSAAVIEVYEIHSREEKNSMTTTYLFPY